MDQQRHEMILELTHASGMQGWYCPTCGRRILFLVPPNNEMVVVEPGDLYAMHSGSIGGLQMKGVDVMEKEPLEDEIPEESLRPWLQALDDLDLDW